MSKLLCTCGHVIVDQTDFLSYKAALLADEDGERFWQGMARGLADMLASARESKLDAWARRNLRAAADRLDDESLVSEYQLQFDVRFLRTVYQCERCRRLWVEDPRKEHAFQSFVPEDASPAGALVTGSSSK